MTSNFLSTFTSHHGSTDMTYDHTAAGIHRAELDREIESIQTERMLGALAPSRDGLVRRVRRSAGRALIAAGTALVGRERGTLRAHRA